jgi:hypothetical protein
LVCSLFSKLKLKIKENFIKMYEKFLPNLNLYPPNKHNLANKLRIEIQIELRKKYNKFSGSLGFIPPEKKSFVKMINDLIDE